MDHDLLERARRAFVAEEHIVNVYEGEWMPLQEEDGTELIGIRGRNGAYGMTIEKHEIGGDLIEMQPGSSFGTHVHEGDHLLFCVRGEGQVYIDGELRHWRAGDTVFIAADYPHGVTAYGVEHYAAKGYKAVEELGPDVASGRDVARMEKKVPGLPGKEKRAEFVILAVGVPHKRVEVRDRMRRIRDRDEEREIAERIRESDV